jgi:hypothetical protein
LADRAILIPVNPCCFAQVRRGMVKLYSLITLKMVLDSIKDTGVLNEPLYLLCVKLKDASLTLRWLLDSV